MFKGAIIAAAMAMLPVAGQAASYIGEFWNSPSGFSTIDAAISFADSNTATGKFVSTTIDYPNGSTRSFSDRNTMAAFLGVDAASFTGTTPSSLETSVFRISGTFMPGEGVKKYSVGSDDGFALEIGGTEIARHSRPRGFGYTNAYFDAGSGPVDFVLTYYENYGNTGLHFKIDHVTVTDAIAYAPSNAPAAVPLPAALPLMMAGLGVLGIAGRRRAARS